MSLTVVNRLADHHWCAAAATATMLTAAHMVPAAGANIVGTMASAAASSAVLRPRFTLQPRLISAPEIRSEEHTSELHSQSNLGCRLLLEKKIASHALVRTAATPSRHPVSALRHLRLLPRDPSGSRYARRNPDPRPLAPVPRAGPAAPAPH